MVMWPLFLSASNSDVAGSFDALTSKTKPLDSRQTLVPLANLGAIASAIRHILAVHAVSYPGLLRLGETRLEGLGTRLECM